MAYMYTEQKFHKDFLDKKKNLRESYLDTMDSPIPIISHSSLGLITKALSKTLNPSKYEFKKMEEEIKIAMRLEAKLQELKAKNNPGMPANEFLKELGKW